MKVLVTGATGFIGRWLVSKLQSEGLDVRILRRRSSSEKSVDDSSVEVAWGDITDPESLIAACRDVHSIFHLAGVVGYSRSQRKIMEQVNVGGTQNIVQAAIENKVSRMVHMSSVVAIGASFDGSSLLNENSEFNLGKLDLGYFETKRKGEGIVRQAVKEGLLDAVIVNPSTVYGAGDAEKGSRGVQRKVAQGRFPFYTSGGVNVIAVEDVVDAIVSAWRRGRPGERYILSGHNITIHELFSTLADIAGQTPPWMRLPNPLVHLIGMTGDLLERFGRKGPLNSESAWASILFHWFDNSKAKAELSLNPRPYRFALENSVNWMKEKNLLN